MKTREYKAWIRMKMRCAGNDDLHRRRYKERGITVCESWNKSFNAFHSDMGDIPSKLHSLDRINNDLGYFPDNCRWATKHQQANNTSRNIVLTIDGVSKTAKQWSDISGINDLAIRVRFHNGWSHYDCVFKPLRISSRTRNVA